MLISFLICPFIQDATAKFTDIQSCYRVSPLASKVSEVGWSTVSVTHTTVDYIPEHYRQN